MGDARSPGTAAAGQPAERTNLYGLDRAGLAGVMQDLGARSFHAEDEGKVFHASTKFEVTGLLVPDMVQMVVHKRVFADV